MSESAAPCQECGGVLFHKDGCSAADENRTSSAARSYATANGFYLGDKVMLPDGRTGYIDEIVVPAFRMTLDGNEVYSNSVVRLDDELWSDGSLTRVG